MKKAIILLSLIFVLNSCNKEVSKENVGVNSGSITNTGIVEVSKKDENLAIENSGSIINSSSLEEEKVSSGSFKEEKTEKIDLGDGYVKDNNNIYYYGKRIEGVDQKTFKILKDGIAEDKNNVYNEGEINNTIGLKVSYNGKKYSIMEILKIITQNENLLLNFIIEDEEHNKMSITKGNLKEFTKKELKYLGGVYFEYDNNIYIIERGYPAGYIGLSILESVNTKSFKVLKDFIAQDEEYFYFKNYGFISYGIGKIKHNNKKINILSDRFIYLGDDLYYFLYKFTNVSMGGIDVIIKPKKVNFIKDFQKAEEKNNDYYSTTEYKIYTKDNLYIDYGITVDDYLHEGNIYFDQNNNYNLMKLNKKNIDYNKLLYKFDIYEINDDISNYYKNINDGNLQIAFNQRQTKQTFEEFKKGYNDSAGKTQILFGPYKSEDKKYHTLVKIGEDFYYSIQEIIDKKINTIQVLSPKNKFLPYLIFENFIIDLNSNSRFNGKFELNSNPHEDMKYNFIEKSGEYELIVVEADFSLDEKK